MPATRSKLSVAEASAAFLEREYPSLDEMILFRIRYAIGKLLDCRRDEIAAGDETVKTALSGGTRYNLYGFGEIFTPGEVSALSELIDPGYGYTENAIDVVGRKVSKLVPVGSELRELLDCLGLVFVSYRHDTYANEDRYYLGIGKKR